MNPTPQRLPQTAAPNLVLDFDDLPPHFHQSKKAQFLKHMLDTFGNVTVSCQKTGISRGRVAQWRNEDPVFNLFYLAEDYKEMKKDWLEAKLVKLIENGKEISTIFGLKALAKDRGYVEKQMVEATVSTDKNPSWFDSAEDIPHEDVTNQNPDTHEQPK